jgi:thiamine biosynthesis lipoprotein
VATAFKAAAVAANSRVVSVARVLLPLALLLPATSPNRVHGEAPQRGGATREYRYLMGTSVVVEVYGGEEGTRRAAIADAFAAVAEVDRLMSNYRDDSELSRINHLAAGAPVQVSDPMLSVLEAAQRVSRASHGAFDITVGPIVRLWGFHDKKPHQPTAAEFATARPLVDYRNLLIDPERRAVRFARSGVEIDLGGIAKGFAVELAASALRSRGLDGLIDAGGNQYFTGTPPGKGIWSVGIKHPDRPDQLLGVIETSETSVSTSSDASTFVEIDGRKYGHILDPHTLQPSTAALSVTILSRDGTLADAMSKAAFVLGPKAGLALIDSFGGLTGLIAYRDADGSIALAMSAPLKRAFHRPPR